ncbi:MAG: hypothetical protein EZS28_052673, partial [Streblomastix strix]
YAHNACVTVLEEGRLLGGLQNGKDLVAQRYKVTLTLTDEQCLDISKEIFEEFESNRRTQKTQSVTKNLRNIVETESALFTRVTRVSIGLINHTDLLMPQIQFLGNTMKACGEMTRRLQNIIIDLQRKRRCLEEIALRDAVSKKNASLALDWIEGRRIEAEAKDIEDQIKAEEAE